jgi:hypothetical protein
MAETTDRRLYRRVKAAMLVRPAGAIGHALPRRVRDASLGGLRVYADDAPRCGARLELELFLDEKESVTCITEVVWVEALPEGAPAAFDVGLRYVHVLPEDFERIGRVLAAQP